MIANLLVQMQANQLEIVLDYINAEVGFICDDCELQDVPCFRLVLNRVILRFR
jgi:hypothetical protein